MTVPVYSILDTWNAGATTFTGIGLNVTDTASASASKLLDLQVGGASQFTVRKDGVATVPARMPFQNVAAAGANQGAATLLSVGHSNVNSGTGGVRLPPIVGGEEFIVYSNIGLSVTVNLYPATGESVNGRAVNAAVTILNGQFALIKGIAPGVAAVFWGSNQNQPQMSLLGFNQVSILWLDESNGTSLYCKDFAITTNQNYVIGVPSGNRIFLNKPSNGVLQLQQYISPDSAARDLARFTGAIGDVNYLNLTAAAAGAAVSIAAVGADTDIDLMLSGKGAGVLKFGTRAAIGAETITGYITIKDAGGTSRKLAVVS